MVVIKKSLEHARQKIIDKGGSNTGETNKSTHTTICLRLPITMLEEIDLDVATKAGFNRTTWILQVLQKELFE